MPEVTFKDLMAEAERGQYAVGYFESWDMQSLLAVADAAEKMRSPVILGFSGIYLPHPERRIRDRLEIYAAMAMEVCRGLSVPACVAFNESPNIEWVMKGIDLGFQMVMFTDESLRFEEQRQRVCEVAERALRFDVAVEAEMLSPPGVDGELSSPPDDFHLTDAGQAMEFVDRTGIDALAVNIGQVHLHGRRKVHLNLARLAELRSALSVPLVLHGASSICHDDIAEAIKGGIRKVNVGSVLKRIYFEAMRNACNKVGDDCNPYRVIGSGLADDVHEAGRVAMQKTVEEFMGLFGSAGKAGQ